MGICATVKEIALDIQWVERGKGEAGEEEKTDGVWI